MIGGQDDQVFDGGSFVLNPGGALAVKFPVFDEVIEHVDFEETDGGWRALEGRREVFPDAWEQDYRVMVTGLRPLLCQNPGSNSVCWVCQAAWIQRWWQ